MEERLQAEIMIRLLGAACSPTQEEGEVISLYLQLCAVFVPSLALSLSLVLIFLALGQK